MARIARIMIKLYQYIKGVFIWGNYKKSTFVPPVSVFDTKQGYWQKRKRAWKEYGLDSGAGRAENLTGGGYSETIRKKTKGTNGTSVFDPVLCEIVYNWYCMPGGIVFDPFAGGSVRGIVAEKLGRHYVGIDLSQSQVDANQITADRLGVCPVWHCDDAKNANQYMPEESADLVFSCPPYHNLERYSNHPLDLSNMCYTDFCEAYGEIIGKACRILKNDRFAVFVVGDIRDSKGAYRDFTGLTKREFMQRGLCLYNESILLGTYASAPMRAACIFPASRKTVKVHQNVLVFYKGDIKKIRENFPTEYRFAKLENAA